MSFFVFPVERTGLLVALFACAAAHACTKSSETSSRRAEDEGDGTREVSAAPASGAPKTAAATSPSEESTQWYRAAFRADDGPEIPVYLALPRFGSRGAGKVVNGEHASDIEAAWSGKQLTVSYPLAHARVDATLDAKGQLTGGTWRVQLKALGAGRLPFSAQPVDGPAPEQRFDEKSLPGPPIDLGAPTTTWRARFSDSGTVKLVLHQVSPGVFNATALFQTGNAVYLAGNGRGNEIRLSSLITLSFYLLTVEIDPARKTLTGGWIAGPKLDWREKLKAKRTEDFELAMDIKTTEKNQRLSMPQVERYRGKPVIVELAGSWCDACEHAAIALKKIYDRHHAQGLEIVTLSYEFTDDSAYNAEQAERFKATYGIPWEVIPVDGAPDRAVETLPQGLEGVDVSGFPVTLFVRADGSIGALHSSFAGPEHPEEHRRSIAEYDRGVAAILAADPGASK